MREMTCLRCREDMRFIRREKLQLGQTGWILGDLPNLIAGALEVDIYVCPTCGKLEFFVAEEVFEEEEDRIAQIKCPQCGHEHDIDYPKCPFCKFDYNAR